MYQRQSPPTICLRYPHTHTHRYPHSNSNSVILYYTYRRISLNKLSWNYSAQNDQCPAEGRKVIGKRWKGERSGRLLPRSDSSSPPHPLHTPPTTSPHGVKRWYRIPLILYSVCQIEGCRDLVRSKSSSASIVATYDCKTESAISKYALKCKSVQLMVKQSSLSSARARLCVRLCVHTVRHAHTYTPASELMDIYKQGKQWGPRSGFRWKARGRRRKEREGGGSRDRKAEIRIRVGWGGGIELLEREIWNGVLSIDKNELSTMGQSPEYSRNNRE